MTDRAILANAKLADRRGREQAMAGALRCLDDGSFERELARRVALPTESQEPRRAPELAAYLEAEMRPTLEALGFRCRLVLNPRAGAPFLIAERLEDPARPTVLGYGHGDVVRGMEGAWAAGRSPWRLTRESDRFYGRGTADNKGQHTINLQALAAVIEARSGELGWNAKFLFEMGEEIGSPGLREICAAEREALRADVLIASDGPRLAATRPTLFLGARGALTFDLKVALRGAAHHSGNWGGLLANPGILLVHAIAAIVGPTGRLELAALRPPVIPALVAAALAGCPVGEDEDAPAIDTWWGEPGLSSAEKVFGWNSFEVLAMTAGVPDAPVNAIPPMAWARCQLRFVVDTNVDEILPAVRHRLDQLGLGMVAVEEAGGTRSLATRLDPDDPWVHFAADSIVRALGRQPAILPNIGGSLPNDAFSEILRLPTVWVPHSHPGCKQHAPDEHLLLSVAREGLAAMTCLYWDLGEGTTPFLPRNA